MTDKCACILAKAVIVNSVKDYLELNRWLMKYPEDNGTMYWTTRYYHLLEVREFFYNDWFKELTDNKMNSKWLISKMDAIVLLKHDDYTRGRDRLIRRVNSVMRDIWGI